MSTAFSNVGVGRISHSPGALACKSLAEEVIARAARMESNSI
jgi:hypothetical protein